LLEGRDRFEQATQRLDLQSLVITFCIRPESFVHAGLEVANDKGCESEFVTKSKSATMALQVVDYLAVFALSIVALNIWTLRPPKILLRDQRKHPDFTTS